MQCPRCGLFNPPEALRCDCGYDFPTGAIRSSYLPAPPEAPEAHLQREREYRAFRIVPLVAIGAWYVLTLLQLAVLNGGIRWRQDVLAMGLGSVVVGLPVAALTTVLLALPLYWIVTRTLGLRLWTALAGGLVAGTLLTVFFWMLNDGMSSTFTPVHGTIGGTVTAAAWWLRAGRPVYHA